MLLAVKLLAGLPPYGPLAVAFPAAWGRFGREGTVVKFEMDSTTWVANFRPGFGGIELAQIHPNKRDAVVVAAGDLWIVDPDRRKAEILLPAVETAFEVQNPDGWVFSRQGLALARLGPKGFLWHTKRLSWDGFDQLQIAKEEITGLAWDLDAWIPFRVDLKTGRSTGGCFYEDNELWESLAE